MDEYESIEKRRRGEWWLEYVHLSQLSSLLFPNLLLFQTYQLSFYMMHVLKFVQDPNIFNHKLICFKKHVLKKLKQKATYSPLNMKEIPAA